MSTTVRRAFSRRALLGLEAPARQPHARIGDACLASIGVMCESCAESCEHSAIRFSRRGFVKQPFIDTDACTGCEECLSVCPVSAISIVRPREEEQ